MILPTNVQPPPLLFCLSRNETTKKYREIIRQFIFLIKKIQSKWIHIRVQIHKPIFFCTFLSPSFSRELLMTGIELNFLHLNFYSSLFSNYYIAQLSKKKVRLVLCTHKKKIQLKKKLTAYISSIKGEENI